ncbi:MAG: energy-coupling factor transporter ATPase, partial [Oscillospiraceae bacterium]|jgi:energy-coupling factor transport system ATP-binding protein|nr:energy-coupling factor transporter ATPase [Oscillospiraceae bacterium]
MDAFIKTEGISHTYSVGTPFERAAIRDVSFEARRGEYVGIIGRTGSGKSTFIQHLNGLLKPETGRVLLDGIDIHSSKQETRRARFRVGLVFQFPEYQLFEETVYKDIAFGPRNMGLENDETDARVREAARFVDLPEDMLEKSPFELSGGYRRRAAVAGVIAMRPEVLILDEPTAGLDPRGRDSLLENIDAYHSELGAAVIIVTHSMEEAARRAERIAVFENGGIVMNGTPEEIFREGERLEKMGLGVPKAARIAERLRALGVPLESDIFTAEAVRDALIAIKNGGGINAS